MKWLALLPLALLLAAAALEVPSSPVASGEPGLWYDEFGRSHALVFLVSTGRSLAFGAAVSSGSMAAAFAAAFVIAGLRSVQLRTALQASTRIIESVPLMLWVLAAFAAFRGASTVVAGLALAAAAVPVLTSVLLGEFERVLSQPYVDAARLLAVDRWRILRRHVLPNAAPVLAPLFIQVLGVATAIRGATGLLGFGTRYDYDLGVLLVRGREQVEVNPLLLLATIIIFLLIYLYLDWLARSLTKRSATETRIKPY